MPLLWHVPGLPANQVSRPVSAVDHLATVIDLLDLPVDFSTEGCS